MTEPRLQEAVDLHRDIDMELVAGNFSESLGPTLAGLPGDEPIVVALVRTEPVHTGPAWRVSLELVDLSDEAPELAIDDGSGRRVVGRAQPHGEWLVSMPARRPGSGHR